MLRSFALIANVFFTILFLLSFERLPKTVPPSLWIRGVQFFIIVGCLATIVVLARREEKGRIVVMAFNVLLLAFAISIFGTLGYFQLRYGGQPLMWGLTAGTLFLIPPLLSLVALTRRRRKHGNTRS